MMTLPIAVFPSATDLGGIRERWRTAGARIRRHLEVPDKPWSLGQDLLLFEATVTDEMVASQAVQAAVRGAGLFVSCPDAPLSEMFIQDLHRTGRNVVRVDLHPRLSRPPGLSEEAESVLRGLAAGGSIPEVASELFLSQRTAERRVVQGRTALGVATTAEAVAAVRDFADDVLAVIGDFPALDPAYRSGHDDSPAKDQ